MSEKKKSSLEKIKDTVTGLGGALAMGTGIATLNPTLVISGATSVFASILAPTLATRRENWFSDLKTRLDNLEDKIEGFSAEKVLQKDDVATAVLQATQIAIMTHYDEKREILRNAVLNTALEIDIAEDEKSMFLNIINDLTPVDIRVLKLWYDPKSVLDDIVVEKYQNEPISKTHYEVAIPDVFGLNLNLDQNLYSVILNNLETRGLLQNTKGRHSTTLSPHGDVDAIVKGLVSVMNERTTSFGRRFLDFIAEPKLPIDEKH